MVGSHGGGVQCPPSRPRPLALTPLILPGPATFKAGLLLL